MRTGARRVLATLATLAVGVSSCLLAYYINTRLAGCRTLAREQSIVLLFLLSSLALWLWQVRPGGGTEMAGKLKMT